MRHFYAESVFHALQLSWMYLYLYPVLYCAVSLCSESVFHALWLSWDVSLFISCTILCSIFMQWECFPCSVVIVGCILIYILYCTVRHLHAVIPSYYLGYVSKLITLQSTCIARHPQCAWPNLTPLMGWALFDVAERQPSLLCFVLHASAQCTSAWINEVTGWVKTW